jgi:cobalt-zinc-cadmium efflux system protein
VHTHSHAHSRSLTLPIKIALAISLGLVAVEFVAGTLSNSLALISDGWHNLSDLPTLGLAWIALYFERKPPNFEKTFGYQRAGVLAAFVNALGLGAVAVFISIDGYRRILHPEQVSNPVMIRVGILALVINTFITLTLSRDRHDLNLRVLFLHNLGDALSNIAIIAGGWLIGVTGQPLIDPVIAFLIAGMILWTAIGVLADSANILLESLPKGMTLEKVARAMLTVEGVREVHDVHIWSLGSLSHALSCHVQILDMPTSDAEMIGEKLRELLAREFHITHTTIQFEHTHPPGDFHRYMPAPAPLEPKQAQD